MVSQTHENKSIWIFNMHMNDFHMKISRFTVQYF